jgi:hypothetical protein
MISNILEQEDVVKGLPDEALQKEARAPSGMLQQFLVIHEIKRRTDMRKSHENQMKEQPQGTVADQIVMEGIAGMMPQQGVGMPPQMGPQMPPQGGPQMPPQGMPPQGGPQMPPQMPPQGMPPQMPPMGMASGGIVRMANGGSTGMPGAYALAGLQSEYVDPLMARARVLAKTTGRSVEEAYEALVREAQMNMPDYQMVGRTGTGEISDMIAGARSAMGDTYDSVIREAQMNMPDYSMIAPAGMGELPSIKDIDSAVGSGIQDMYGTIPQSSSVGMADRISTLTDELGITGVDRDAKRRARIEKNLQQSEGFRQKPGTEPADPLASVLELAQEVQTDASSPFYKMKPSEMSTADRGTPPRGLIPGVTNRDVGFGPGMVGDPSEAGGIGPYLAGMFKRNVIESDFDPRLMPGNTTRTQVTNQMLGIGPSGPVSPADVFGTKKAKSFELTPENIETIDALQTLAEGSEARGGAGPASQGDNVANQGTGSGDASRASFNSAISSIDELISDLKNKETQQSPALDLSDLIADSKRMAKANTLMQLGAGIAAGDTAKALSAAGTAAAKGMEDARTLDMRKRLAEYQAGREDIRRGEQRDLDIAKLGLQKEQLSLLSEKYQNELAKAASVGRNELFRTASSIVDAAMAGSTEVDPDARKQQAYALMNEFLTLYAPTFGVTSIPTLPTGGSGAGAAVDPAQFDRTGG